MFKNNNNLGNLTYGKNYFKNKMLSLVTKNFVFKEGIKKN